MLRRIIEGSASNPFLVGLGIVALLVWGGYAVYRMPLDAIPDLSDVQVIVFTEFPGQAPQVVEDQVTYPLTTAMLFLLFVAGEHLEPSVNQALHARVKAAVTDL